jgi:hypothetical protein
MLVILVVAAVLLEIGAIKVHDWLTGAALGNASGLFKVLIVVWNKAMTYAFPILVAAFLCVVGARQRLPLGWIAVGAVLGAILGGAYTADVVFSAQKGMSEFNVGFGVSSSIWPRLLLNMTLAGLMTAGCWLWRRRETLAAE